MHITALLVAAWDLYTAVRDRDWISAALTLWRLLPQMRALKRRLLAGPARVHLPPPPLGSPGKALHELGRGA